VRADHGDTVQSGPVQCRPRTALPRSGGRCSGAAGRAIPTALLSWISMAVHAAQGPLQLHRHGGAVRYPALRLVGVLEGDVGSPRVSSRMWGIPKVSGQGCLILGRPADLEGFRSPQLIL
jgi:hypothetical protein